MKKIILSLCLLSAAVFAQGKTALMVISHGAPGMSWNAKVLDVEKKLQQVDIPGISYKRVALMEFSKPDIKAVVDDCEAQGCDTIFALPLFIAPSSHSEDDIPNILNLKYIPEVRKGLAEEKANIVHSKARIIVGPPLYYGNVIEKAMLARVKSISKDPKNEALILVAHGDPDRIGFWQELLDRNVKNIKDSTGIEYADTKFIAMGQNIVKDIQPVLTKAAKAKKRILVQAVYLTSSIGEIAKILGLDKETKKLTGSDTAEVVYSDGGILPDSEQDVIDWIVSTTESWRHQALGSSLHN